MKIFLMAGIITATLLLGGPAFSKVDLVTLPGRDTVQLTIYNSADLTLVRENRALTLMNGANRLQFSWENTLIDPTSLEMLPKASADKLDILNLDYPPRIKNVGIWEIDSRTSGKVPVEISYLTSGLAWKAFYMGTLSRDEKTMRLQGYVRVTNNSGEDYENSQVRLVVGKINLEDQIANLARRNEPYGRPNPTAPPVAPVKTERRFRAAVALGEGAGYEMDYAMQKPKEIVKEGLSEYFLYTIEGTETIPNGWSKRLQCLEIKDVPVMNLYKYDENKYGGNVIRFISFKNDKEHKMGDTPIPGGVLKAFRQRDDSGRLSYEGQSEFKYIPVDEDVELNLGPEKDVAVLPVLMDFKQDNFVFDKNGDIRGCDIINEYEVTVKNSRDIPANVEITRKCDEAYPWVLEKSGDFGQFEKIDKGSVKFALKLNPRAVSKFKYKLVIHTGDNAFKTGVSENQ